MSLPSPPVIFSSARRLALRERMLRAQRQPDAPRYLVEDMADDMLERLSFLRHAPRRALVVGDFSGILPAALKAMGAQVVEAEPAHGFDEEHFRPTERFDFIASLSALDTVNDLPGALILIREALELGGLAIASMAGAGSLPALRAAMLVADGDRPAPRLHPMIDVRAGGQLLQRAGWFNPVIDSRGLDVRYSSLDRLVDDLRAQGLANVLARSGPPLTRAGLTRARAAFGQGTTERFEILTLSGWRR